MAQVRTGYKWSGFHFTRGAGLPRLKEQSRKRNAEPGMFVEASLDASGPQNLVSQFWEQLKNNYKKFHIDNYSNALDL